MSDQSTAASWFVENILKERFCETAKNKKFDISRINNLVASIQLLDQNSPSPTLPENCPHCGKRFSSNSRPVKCPKCSNYKHTTKCAPCPTGTTSTRVSQSTSRTVSTSSLLTTLTGTSTTPSLGCSSIGREPDISTTGMIEIEPPTSTIKRAKYHISAPGFPLIISSSTTTPIVSVMPSTVAISTSIITDTTSSLTDSVPTTIQDSPTTSQGPPPPPTTLASPSLSQAPHLLQPISNPSQRDGCTATQQQQFNASDMLPSFPFPPDSALPPQPKDSRKRKANQKSASKSAEQTEIDFLKLELNAVKTEVLELEASKRDLENKNKILTDVLKMHEQRQVASAYSSTFQRNLPQASVPPQPSTFQPNQPSCSSIYSPPSSCHQHPAPVYFYEGCCNRRNFSQICKPGNSQNIHPCNNSSPTFQGLKLSVERIEGELIDVVDKLEKLHSKVSQNDHESSTTKKKPLFRNPMDIPNFNEIEIVDVEIHNEQINESAASMDDFVPDVSQDELVNQRPSLNSQNLTNQLNI